MDRLLSDRDYGMRTLLGLVTAVIIASYTPVNAQTTKCAAATSLYSEVCAPALGLMDCDIDGRLKGVRINSELFRRTIATFPNSQCLSKGPNGTFVVDIHGAHYRNKQ